MNSNPTGRQIAEMRAQGRPWAEICATLGISRSGANRRLREHLAAAPSPASTNGAAFQGGAAAHVPADDEVDRAIEEATNLLRLAARGGSAPAARALLAEARRMAQVRCEGHFTAAEVQQALYTEFHIWDRHLDALARRACNVTGADLGPVQGIFEEMKSDVSGELAVVFANGVDHERID